MDNPLLSAERWLFSCAVFAVLSVFFCLQIIILGTRGEKNFPLRIRAIGMREPDG